jgi:hypothetical protein
MLKYNVPLLEELPAEDRKALLENAQVFEKLDGGTCQIEVDYRWGSTLHDVKFGFRSGKKTLPKNTNKWHDKFSRFFYDNYETLAVLKPGVYIGEFLAPHTLRYKPGFENTFFLLDVHDGEKIIPYDEAVRRIAGVPNIHRLYPIMEGKIDEKGIEKFFEGSPYSVSGFREGVVMKNYDKQLFGKITRKDFEEARVVGKKI